MIKIQTVFDTIRRKLETLDETIEILLAAGIEYCDTKQMQAKIRLFEIEEEEKQRRLDADRKYYEAKSRTREKTHKTIEKGGNHNPMKQIIRNTVTAHNAMTPHPSVSQKGSIHNLCKELFAQLSAFTSSSTAY